MLFSQHSHRSTSSTRNSPAADLTHRQLETNQCSLSVHTGHVAFTHFIFRRCWFDRGDLISSPSNLYLFVLRKFNKVHFAVCFQQRKLCHGTPVDTGPLSWWTRHRKTLMAHAHTHVLTHSHGRCTVQCMASLCDIWKEHLSSEWKMPPRPHHTNTKKQRTVSC